MPDAIPAVRGSVLVAHAQIMNMVYLVTETRSKLGEKGINDPAIKLVVTISNFCGLVLLDIADVIDPSLVETNTSVTVARDIHDTNLPLPGVCKTMSTFGRGFLVLVVIMLGCLAFVIFGTSQRKLTELLEMMGANKLIKHIEGKPKLLANDLNLGKLTLFIIYFTFSSLIMVFFLVPFYSEGGTRVTDGWKEACDSYDKETLQAMGLS